MADKKSSVWTSLPMQMMFGLVLGVIVGAFTNPEFAQTWFRPLGDLFIRLIRMVVVPLVFATLVAGAAGISDVSKLGRVAIRTLALFLVTSAISVVFGLVIANLIDPGVGVTLSTEGLKAAQVNAPSFVKTLLEIVPINPMEAFAKGSILQIIFFAIMFGFCLNAMGEKGRAMYEFFDVMGHIMIRMTNIVMRYAPIGVFGLMAAVVAQHGIAVLLPLGKLILASFIATALLIIIVYIPWVKFWIRIPLGQYFKGIFEPWLIAFTACSSAAAMAANLVASRRLAGWSSLEARRAHNPKVIGSNPVPATKKNTYKVELTMPYMGHTLRTENQEREISLPALDKGIDVLERQMKKLRTRLARDLRKKPPVAEATSETDDDDEEETVVRIKRYASKPMSVEDAILEMDMLGHTFYMFNNVESGRVATVYRRKDGGCGLIELE